MRKKTIANQVEFELPPTDFNRRSGRCFQQVAGQAFRAASESPQPASRPNVVAPFGLINEKGEAIGEHLFPQDRPEFLLEQSIADDVFSAQGVP